MKLKTELQIISDKASLKSLSPEALQTQYKDYGLLLAIPYHRASLLRTTLWIYPVMTGYAKLRQLFKGYFE